MNILKYILYTILLVFIWAFLFLISMGDTLNMTLGLVYTYYSTYVIRHFVEQETSSLKIIKLLGPAFYVVMMLILMPIGWFTLLSPILWGFGIVLITSFDKRQFPKWQVQFFVVMGLYLFSLGGYPMWETGIKNSYPTYNFDLGEKEILPPKDTTKQEVNYPLAHYKFLNKKLDTIQLHDSDKYTIIETWNEQCPPCMRAIPGMHEFYESIQDKAQQFHVYVPARKNHKLDYPGIFSFELIANKDQIIVDTNLQEDAGLQGYPYFLVFDPDGNLVLQHLGYNPAKKEELQQSIRKAMEEV